MTYHTLHNATLVDTTGKNPRQRVINDRPIDGHIKVLDLGAHTERYIDYEKLCEGIANGEVRVERPGQPTPSKLLKQSPEDDKALAEAMDLVALVKREMQITGASVNKAYEQLVEKESKGAPTDYEGRLRSKATIYRLLQKARQGLPLLQGSHTKGNRTARFSEEVRDLIAEQADLLYLVPHSKWSLKSLAEHVTLLAQEQGLLPQERKVSRDYVSKVILEDLSSDPEKDRMAPGDAIAAKAVARKRIRVLVPLQRVEQDALHIPWTLLTPWGISNDVWLVHAIECACSIPVGWYLTVGHPTTSASLKCIERMLYPKKPLLQKLAIATAVDLYGLPMHLIFDNGPETKGPRIRSVSRLGTKVDHCKAKAAHGKPFIERLNRSIKEALEVLPSTTRFDGKDGQRDPLAEGDEILSIEEFEYWLVRWYFNKWIHTPLKRLTSAVFTEDFKGATPAQRYERVVNHEQYALPLPPNLTAWQMVFFEKVQVTLNRKSGVTYDTFSFGGRNLPRVIDLFGERQIDVLVDPDDFRRVYVPINEGTELLELTNKDVDEATPAYSFARAKEMRKTMPMPEAPEEARQFDKDLYKRAAASSAPRSTPRKSTRAMSKDTTQRAKDAEAINRATDQPLTPEPVDDNAGVKDQAAKWKLDEAGVFELRDSTTGAKKF